MAPASLDWLQPGDKDDLSAETGMGKGKNRITRSISPSIDLESVIGSHFKSPSFDSESVISDEVQPDDKDDLSAETGMGKEKNIITRSISPSQNDLSAETGMGQGKKRVRRYSSPSQLTPSSFKATAFNDDYTYHALDLPPEYPPAKKRKLTNVSIDRSGYRTGTQQIDTGDILLRLRRRWKMETVTFLVYWDLKQYVQEELESDFDSKDFASVLEDVLTITGTVEKAYASSLRDYIKWKWPNSKLDILEHLKEAVQRTNKGKSTSFESFPSHSAIVLLRSAAI